MQYAYGARGEVFVYMAQTVASLAELCTASGIDVDNIVKPIKPMLPGVAKQLMTSLGPEGVVPHNDVWYRSMHGVIQWMEHIVRLDVSFPVRVLGAALGRNTPAHDEAMMRLISWVLTHPTDGLVYGGDKAARDKGFLAWMDASFADGHKARSTQGSIFKFSGSVVSWSSKQQSCVAQDTMESEYISASTYIGPCWAGSTCSTTWVLSKVPFPVTRITLQTLV